MPWAFEGKREQRCAQLHTQLDQMGPIRLPSGCRQQARNRMPVLGKGRKNSSPVDIPLFQPLLLLTSLPTCLITVYTTEIMR